MNNLDLLVPGQTKSDDKWLWATVTQVSPLRVRLDGDAAALPITPENLAYGLSVNQRVWVQLSGHRVIVHGVNGGTPSATPTHTHSNYALTSHTHATPALNITSRSWGSYIGSGSSYSNGSYTTIGIWEPGPTWPSGANGAIVSFSVNGDSDVNAAGYYEPLFHNGSAWQLMGYVRVHNNGAQTTPLGFSSTHFIDRQETSLGDLRVAVNLSVDSGGGWIATGPINCQVSFVHNA